MKNLSRTVLIFILIFCSCITAFSADDKYFILDVEGEGADRASAMDSAWLEGIRQAAGSFIDSKTELNDDKLTKRIISYSRGLVEKYEIISVDDSKVSDGIYKLKKRMWIVKEILRDGTRHATTNSSEISFSASDLKRTKEDDINANAIEKHDVAAKTVKRKAQTALELLEVMLDRYKPEDFLTCYILAKPELAKDKPDFFTLNVEINFNEKFYKEAFIPDLIQVLDQIASAKKNSLEILPYVKNIKASLLLGDEPIRQLGGWLGLIVVQEKDGVVVKKFDAGSPAVKSPIAVGDVIVAINGVSVKTAEALYKTINLTRPGQTIKIKYRYRNNESETDITLCQRP